MDLEEMNERIRALELRAVAQTTALAILLQEVPNASAKLNMVIEHLVDAPPTPMSEEDIVKTASYMHAMLGGSWMD